MQLLRTMNRDFLSGFLMSVIVTALIASIAVLPYPYCGGGITCVSNPINELETKIRAAESGVVKSTDIICLYTSESYSTQELKSRVPDVNSIIFKCDGAAVCKNDRPLKVESNVITSIADVQFKGIVACTESSGKYDCTITIKSA